MLTFIFLSTLLGFWLTGVISVIFLKEYGKISIGFAIIAIVFLVEAVIALALIAS